MVELDGYKAFAIFKFLISFLLDGATVELELFGQVEGSAQIDFLIGMLASLLYLQYVFNTLLLCLKALCIQKRRTPVRANRPAITCLAKFSQS